MRLTILTTGGTIDKTYDELQGSLRNQNSILDVILDELRTPDLFIRHVDVMHKDSLDMTAEDRRIIAKAAPGFGGLQVTRSAYSIGIAFAPDWGEGHIMSIRHEDPRVLQPNMTFHNIPWVQIPGRGGVGMSETIRVTENGCELLTNFERKLYAVDG